VRPTHPTRPHPQHFNSHCAAPSSERQFDSLVTVHIQMAEKIDWESWYATPVMALRDET